MFKIESYITPILLNYVDKYVKDFKPANAQVSLWAGGVALHNLVLKPDVLLQDVSLPFSLVSGRIHELLIQVPWTKIMSEPIVISIDTIECILGLPPPEDTENSPNDQAPKTPEAPEAPPGYMQALVRKIVSNISLRIQHLIVKYVEDDIVLSLNVKRISIDSADAKWNPAFADIDPVFPLLRRLVKLDDLTLCLDRADSDGKIRFFQEPLLYRCQINFRILSKLISVNTRRATNLHVQVHATQLAWGLTTDQISLLIRLFKNHYQETLVTSQKVTVLKPATSADTSDESILMPKADVRASWSGWAWSWLPSWSETREEMEELPAQATPFPIHFTAYFDHMTFVFKVMESDGSTRKKTRGILEMIVKNTAFRALYIMPTTLEATLGIKSLELKAHGKCMCNLSAEQVNEQSKTYLSRYDKSENSTWSWPQNLFEGPNMAPEEKSHSPTMGFHLPQTSKTAQIGVSCDADLSAEMLLKPEKEKESSKAWKYDDPLMAEMQPLLYAVFKHDRMPPDPDINPYDNPPKRFLYSDWVENCLITVQVQPVELRVCTCLIHRLGPVFTSLQEFTNMKEQTIKPLTVEECEALSENLPQRRIEIELFDARVLLIPWEQSLRDKHIPPQLVLQLHIPKGLLQINMPLYPKRVCAAASQIPLKMQTGTNIMWHGARLHIILNVESLYAHLMAIKSCGEQPSLPVASTHFRFVFHRLMHPSLFLSNETVLVSYTLSIKELNLCGSRARIQAAHAIIESLYKQKVSSLLRFTTIAADAIADEEFGAIDLTMEGFVQKGFITRNINTHVFRVQSLRCMVLKRYEGNIMKIAWLFSGSDSSSKAAFFRAAVQWCKEPVENSLDFLGIWMDSMAFCADPLFVAWLAYEPQLRPSTGHSTSSSRSMRSTVISSSAYLKRRNNLHSSSGRGASRSGQELVHSSRARSQESTSERSDLPKERQPSVSKAATPWWQGDGLISLYKRLKHLLISLEIGLVTVYVPLETASAIDSETVREALDSHVVSGHTVLGINLGQISVDCSETMSVLWHYITNDGPTIIERDDSEEKSFPWRMNFSDVSFYLLETAGTKNVGGGKKTQLKSGEWIIPSQILELVTTTITLTVITKTVPVLVPQTPRTSRTSDATDNSKLKLKTSVEGDKEKARANSVAIEEESETKKNVLVGLGINVHADTPPLMIKLDQDQVHSVAACFHGLGHIFELLTRDSMVKKKRLAAYSRLLIRSVSEAEETVPPVGDASDSDSEMLTIFESHHTLTDLLKQKSFFWFQWVINRATLVVASGPLKLVLNIDDIISTLDIQAHYNQLKIKISSAFIRNYERAINDEWTSAAYGGHILEAREPNNAVEDNHFLAVTITNAQISNLPSTWKMEMDPKILQASAVQDTMWEVYATMAPLDITLKPEVVSDLIKLLREMTIKSQCPFKVEKTSSLSAMQWPYFYLSCGGVNILLYSDLPNETEEDAFLITIRKTTVNPHPENPICRRPPNGSQDGGLWLPSNGALEGRQYELLIKSVEISHAQASQILINEKIKEEEQIGGTASENPAVKWTEPPTAPTMTSILNPMEISCIVAPPLYMSNMVVCGPAFEVNLVSDCHLEISLKQLRLINDFMQQFEQHLLRVNEMTVREHNTCPYAHLITPAQPQEESTQRSENLESKVTGGEDSGVNSLSNAGLSSGKKVSYGFLGYADAEQAGYSELYITTGIITVTLYTEDDHSQELWLLRKKPDYKLDKKDNEPPPSPPQSPLTHAAQALIDMIPIQIQTEKHRRDMRSKLSAASITETVRQADVGQLQLQAEGIAIRKPNTIKLIQVRLKQPNIYFWRRKAQKSLQVSLFNLIVSLGYDESQQGSLFYTATGQVDPLTDIPPALATLKLNTNNCGGFTSRGCLSLDIERPVMLSISEDKVTRVRMIRKLVLQCFTGTKRPKSKPVLQRDPPLYILAQYLNQNSIEIVTITTTQLGLSSGVAVIGYSSGSLQVAVTPRPDHMVVRAYVNGLMVTLGPEDERRLFITPLVCGAYLQAAWEKWQQSESTHDLKEPFVKLTIDIDNLIVDLRPDDAIAIKTVIKIFKKYLGIKNEDARTHSTPKKRCAKKQQQQTCDDLSDDDQDQNVQHYKDDLRTGAFKILTGGQFPLAYQITLNNGCVSWKYPHPRAIAKILAYPLPSQTTEVSCVLEHYNTLVDQWEPHMYFSIPVLEAQEITLSTAPPSAIAALMWRCRPITARGDEYPPFEFHGQRYTPKKEPFAPEDPKQNTFPSLAKDVSAEELLGALRVDSIFAPKQLPTKIATCRLALFRIYVHNSLPRLTSDATTLEGYYVSKPFRKSHRVCGLLFLNSVFNGQLNYQHGSLLLMDTSFGVQTIDCMTGAMSHTIENTRLQAAFSYPLREGTHPKVRYVASPMVVSLTMVMVKTLMSLVDDWRFHLKDKRPYEEPTQQKESVSEPSASNLPKRQIAQKTGGILEGRIALWLHNSCSSALRVGQEGTDEVIPLGPGGRLAYRWRSPTATKMLRFTITTPSSDWHWSPSVPFTPGNYRIRLTDGGESKEAAVGKYLFVQVCETATRRVMHIHGRVALVNMLRYPLLYEVRSRVPGNKKWYTIGSGELAPETVGRTVISTMESELVFKIKFAAHKTGWSGDVPLKECPKENVPWLVKVPSDGEVPFISVWCRVIRGRNDARILATIWPLYILQSHLPLDTDVLVTTESDRRLSKAEEDAQTQYPPLIQSAPGRGTTSHIYVPGTTSVRHSLTFQYRNIECPVTKEAVPLHYGVTEGSVFDKKVVVNNIEDILNDLLAWLNESGSNVHSGWPYSVVTDHWPEPWKPALLQPRCDISIRYHPIYAGGGCSLGMQVSPVLLLCNATTLTLTLRAHNAAPLCKIEPGTAISPSSSLLDHPFFMSMEMGRETFVSGSLQVCHAAPARYAAPPSGTVAIDHPAPFAIQCNNKVALLTLYYEIKNNINVLGVSCTYVLINKLDYQVLVSATAVPKNFDFQEPMKPTTFTTVHPSQNSNHGTFLCRFTIFGRWIGNDVDELNLYLNLALANDDDVTTEPVPVRLGAPPARRAVALVNHDKESVPIVVSQVKHGGRWLVTLSEDPCPQFVLRNRTTQPLLVAQPNIHHDPFNSNASMVSDCEGVQWHCQAMPGAILHYSTPAYCQRHPPTTTTMSHGSSGEPPWNYLTFGKIDPEGKHVWSGPVPVVSGEQLVQLPGNHIVKLKVRPHPHSTLVELQNIDHLDISASDIRKRLDSPSLTTSIFISERVASNKSVLLNSAVPADKESIQDGSTKSVQVVECDLSKRSSCENSDDDSDRLSSARPMGNLEAVGDDFFNKGTGYGLSKWDFLRGTLAGLVVKVASAPEVEPLLAVHADRVSIRLLHDRQGLTLFIAARELQVDNLQYPSGQFDFAVVAATSGPPVEPWAWPSLFTMLSEVALFDIRDEDSRLFVRIVQDKWRVCRRSYREITELEIKVGPLGLYIEDAYVQALEHLIRMALPIKNDNEHMSAAVAEMRAIARPLRLRVLHIRPLDLTLTLHTAVRIYIALDQSPLSLSAFRLRDMMTSGERLTHALTVHYLSATLLGAGWVVGGLELLGAPGAVAARVGGARGGVRGVASAAAAALLRSLAACAGSLARNLDLLAGDEEHSRRAAAARRAPPNTLLSGLYAGVTNFAVNMLGAVGGLAHHPLIAASASGESVGGALALRRGLLGALAKPLSATADLVAFAGHGLLAQTGWDPLPQPRALTPPLGGPMTIWQRNCVRWAFRLHEMSALVAYQVLLDRASTLLVITEKLLVIIDPESERVIEMLDMKCCSIAPYQGPVIELFVQQVKKPVKETRGEEEEEFQVSEAAMARVARYTGAVAGGGACGRAITLLPEPAWSHALHATLTALLHHNADTHFSFL